MIDLNLTDSTVKLGDRWFPAVVMICPDNDIDPEPEPVHRMLGGPGGRTPLAPYGGWDVYVPAENGALIGIDWSENRPDEVTVNVHARSCLLNVHGHEALYLPFMMAVVGDALLPIERNGRVVRPLPTWRWEHAEPEWAAEHIDRLSRKHLYVPDGPKVELLRLAEAWEMRPEPVG
ncbi:MAG TPA: hypothetical protein VH482_27405 [Thermomicrobiales bacterium]|jgi:hypothetical protein